MKKLILLSFVLIGCSKADYCVECEKQGLPIAKMCKSDTPDINVITYDLMNRGYTCVKY